MAAKKKKKTYWDRKHAFFLLKALVFASLAVYFGIQTYNLKQASNLTDKIYKSTVNEYNKKLSTYENIITEKTRRDYLLFAYAVRYPEFTTIIQTIYTEATRNAISPYTILSLCSIESDFNTRAVSVKNAYGLLQIVYEIWKTTFKLKKPEDLFDPVLNIKIGCQILKGYLDESAGNVNKALFMYNNGYTGENNKYVPAIMKGKYNKEK